MAVRRPAAPRLHAGRPGARPLPDPEIPDPEIPDPEPRTGAKAAPQEASPAGTTVRGPRRRALLLAGSVAAVIAVPAAAGGLLAGRGGDSLPAAISSGGGGTGGENALSSPFDDVADGSDGLAAMLWAEETGVQPSREDGTYAPDAAVTRGDLAVALHRFGGSPELVAEATPLLIADIGSDPTSARALLWLHGRGALWGDRELRVHPEAEATRRCGAQMVTALMRPALAGVGVRWDPATDSAGLPGLSDSDPTAADVHWLAAAGMLVPPQDAEGAGTWDGEQVLTRGHLATALHRVDQVITGALD